MTRHGCPAKRGRLLRAALLMSLAGMAMGGLANAYWQGIGAGGATASTGATVAVSLGPGSPTATLYPGGQADVVLVVTNPNSAPLHLVALSLDTGEGASGFGVDVGHSGCTLSALSFSPQTGDGSGWTVPANSVLPVTLANALSMDGGAENACQGATFTVYLKAGA